MKIYDFRHLSQAETRKQLDDLTEEMVASAPANLGFYALMTPSLFADLDLDVKKISPRLSSPIMRTLYYKGYYINVILISANKEPTCSRCSDKPYSFIRARSSGIIPSEDVIFMCEHHHNLRALILELKRSN